MTTVLVKGNVYLYHCRWIKNPHDKIAICICNIRHWFLWFNSKAAFHGHGQLAVTPSDHPAAISKNCFLDLSGIKAASEAEVTEAATNDRGAVSDQFKQKILTALALPNPMLPNVHKITIVECFTK